jgi:hypothetical protein
VNCKSLVAAREGKSDHTNTVFVTLKIASVVESLHGIRGVVLIRTKESRETELLCIRLLEELLDEGEVICIHNFRLVVTFTNEVLDLFLKRMEEDSVLVYVL